MQGGEGERWAVPYEVRVPAGDRGLPTPGTSGDTADKGVGGVREAHWEGAGPRLTAAGVLTLPEPEGGAVRTQLESCVGGGAPHKGCGLWERGDPQTW